MRLLQRFDAEVATGLKPSVPLSKNPLWQNGRGVVFREGAVQPSIGQFVPFNKLSVEPIIGMIEAEVEGKKGLFWGGQTKLYRWFEGDGTATDETRLVGGDYAGVLDATLTQPATQWSMSQWGHWILATNGIDEPQVRKTGAVFADMNVDGRFDSCQILIPFKAFVVAMGLSGGTIGDFPDGIAWSDADAPEVWAPTVTNAAGDLGARDMNSPIVGAIPLGRNAIAFFGSDSMHLLTFVGAPNYLGQEKILDGIGLVGKNALARIGNLIYGFGPRGFWRTDGTQPQYIDQPDIREFIFKDVDRDQWSKSVLWHNGAEEEVVLFYPSREATNCDKGVGINYRTGAWSIKNYGRTAASRVSVLDFAAVGDCEGNVFFQRTESFDPFFSSGSPLELEASYSATVGFGMAGFGQMGWGGTQNGTG